MNTAKPVYIDPIDWINEHDLSSVVDGNWKWKIVYIDKNNPKFIDASNLLAMIRRIQSRPYWERVPVARIKQEMGAWVIRRKTKIQVLLQSISEAKI